MRELVNYLRRLMNLAHCSPLTDEEVNLLFQWFDPKGLGAVSKEDMATRIDGYCEQGGVRGMCVVVHLCAPHENLLLETILLEAESHISTHTTPSFYDFKQSVAVSNRLSCLTSAEARWRVEY